MGLRAGLIVCLAIGLIFAGCSHHASPKAEPALIVDPTAAFRAGKQLVAEHHPEQAVAQFDKAIEIDPRYADAYNARGLIRQQSNDLNGACKISTKSSSSARREPRHTPIVACCIWPLVRPTPR